MIFIHNMKNFDGPDNGIFVLLASLKWKNRTMCCDHVNLKLLGIENLVVQLSSYMYEPLTNLQYVAN